MNFHELCQEVMEKDKAIRFVGIATPDGEILVTSYREGLTPLLTVEESGLFMMQSLIKVNMENTLGSKLGRTIFTFTEYLNVDTATFVIYNQRTLEQKAVVMISFDKSADAHSIIERKIKPWITKVNDSRNSMVS